MARLSKKEKLRRQRISVSLKAHYQAKREQAIRRSIAAQKAAHTRKAKKAPPPAYGKPPVEELVYIPSDIKVGHGAKRAKRRKDFAGVRYVPASSVVLPSIPEKAAISEPPKKRRPRPELPVSEPEVRREPPTPKRVPRKPLHLFDEDAEHQGDDTWKGPWSTGRPSDADIAQAVSEIKIVSAQVAAHMSSDFVMEGYGLDKPIQSWALNPVVNDDGTVSGEVRFEVPPGIKPASLSQELQDALPPVRINFLWLTPVIVYEPKTAGVDDLLKLAQSPFEPLRGNAEIQAFSVKYDEDIRIKVVTGFLKAQDMATQRDPEDLFIRASYVRVRIRFCERPPRSAYEMKRMEEERVKREFAKEQRARFVKMKGYKPLD